MGGCNRTVEKDLVIEGELGYFGLDPWWLGTFSGAERASIERVYQHPGLPAVAWPLTMGSGPSAYDSAAGLLTAVASQLGKRIEDRDLAMRWLTKAEERAEAEDDVLGLHFAYDEMICLHDRWKEQFPDASDAVFAACYKQARIGAQAARAFHDRYPMRALPTHAGYELMIVMLAEVDNYERAIDVCQQARTQGWPGDWTARIQNLAKESGCPVRSISSSGMTEI